ncbi:hypothetical protein L6164_022952 [Bauhinia variegata]|uniref:Uncharacterized protein n=1 Tax=Bauhinia variegata TaxID=167791 RepID=A0ACB9MGN2_BAUVA|nr:hypothetical protein L6164_022952 [Bauhinia variegata]
MGVGFVSSLNKKWTVIFSDSVRIMLSCQLTNELNIFDMFVHIYLCSVVADMTLQNMLVCILSIPKLQASHSELLLLHMRLSLFRSCKLECFSTKFQ